MRPLALSFLLAFPAFAAEKIDPAFPPVTSLQKTMTVFQKGGVTDGKEGDIGLACLRFEGHKHPEVLLDEEAISWPGCYYFSPDAHWLLRVQKTSSGDDIGILYRLEKTGVVARILGFNDSLWAASDRVARVKRAGLYHTGVNEAVWDADNRRLTLKLRGSNREKSDEGISLKVVYDLTENTFPGTEEAEIR